MLTFHGSLARVHEQKAARAVGVFGVARLEAALPEQRRLLVSRDARNRHLHALNVACTVDLGGIAHLREHRRRNLKRLKKPLVPAELVDIIEHRPRGVRVVGDMDPAVGELPDEPGVNRAEQQLSPLGFFARTGDIVQNPFDLRAGKIGVQHQTRGLFDVVLQPALFQCIADRGGAPALPDDGVADGFSGFSVPDDGRLALVRDADGSNILHMDVRL